jgi:hypothetical protein
MLDGLQHSESVEQKRDQIGAGHVSLDEHLSCTEPQEERGHRRSDDFRNRGSELRQARKPD